MKMNVAADRAYELMAVHGLGRWRMEWEWTESRLGRCDGLNRVIYFSLFWLDKIPADRWDEVVLHEIAHGIVGTAHQHNDVWARKVTEIGGVAEENFSLDTEPSLV